VRALQPELPAGGALLRQGLQLQVRPSPPPFLRRFCHDEAEAGHTLDRQTVQEVECLACQARGPAAAVCGQCGITFGRAHFCPVCRSLAW
jgi:hypothetical protein